MWRLCDADMSGMSVQPSMVRNSIAVVIVIAVAAVGAGSWKMAHDRSAAERDRASVARFDAQAQAQLIRRNEWWRQSRLQQLARTQASFDPPRARDRSVDVIWDDGQCASPKPVLAESATAISQVPYTGPQFSCWSTPELRRATYRLMQAVGHRRIVLEEGNYYVRTGAQLTIWKQRATYGVPQQ